MGWVFEADGAIEVVVCRLDLDGDAVRALASTLSGAERERAASYAFERDRRRFMVARARLRELLGEHLGIRPEAVQLAYGAHGKPKLANEKAGWAFNVSHSDDLALYAFARGREVGVDVEAVRDQPLAFVRSWTRKEALGKALGPGLMEDLDETKASAWRIHSFSPAPGFIAALAAKAHVLDPGHS